MLRRNFLWGGGKFQRRRPSREGSLRRGIPHRGSAARRRGAVGFRVWNVGTKPSLGEGKSHATTVLTGRAATGETLGGGFLRSAMLRRNVPWGEVSVTTVFPRGVCNWEATGGGF